MREFDPRKADSQSEADRAAAEIRRQMEAFERVGNKALEMVDEDFGTGFPHFHGASAGKWRFHNGFHARRVGDNAARLMSALGYDESDQTFAREVSKAHDGKQGLGRGKDEAASAQWAAEHLYEEGVPEERVNEAILAILGTEPLFGEGGKIIGQKVSQLDFPTKRAKHTAQSVGCGDMAGMCQPEGALLSHELMRELRGGADPNMEEMIGIQDYQIDLLETYAFPLDTARERQIAEETLAPLRGKAIEHHIALRQKILTGEVSTFDEVLLEDVRYLEENL